MVSKRWPQGKWQKSNGGSRQARSRGRFYTAELNVTGGKWLGAPLPDWLLWSVPGPQPGIRPGRISV